MQSDLKILIENGYLSRKQYRELLSELPSDRDGLRALLLEKGYIDPPDWKEAERVLSGGNTDDSIGKSSAPDSSNPAMQQVNATATRVAATDTTVLILGESGVGKTRLARLIHQSSPRRAHPFVTVSCGSIPETLLESELFGVEKGAYTGAVRSREGRFQRAQGGTIFLDEIGELTPTLQVKLLRVLQEKKVEPLGSGTEAEVDVRVITATNRNLEEDIRAGRFREDLYFRLNVVPLTMPPLRERREDILPLTDYFLGRFSAKDSVAYQIDGSEVGAVLQEYSWPGNIRELENCIERMAVLSGDGLLKAADFPARVLEEVGYRPGRRPMAQASAAKTAPLAALEDEAEPNHRIISEDGSFPTLKEMERQHIKRALTQSRGNVYRAATLLKIHRNTLARKLDEMSINPGAFKKTAAKKKKAAARNMT